MTKSYTQAKTDKRFVLAQIKQAFQRINDYKNYKVVTIDGSEEFLGYSTDNGGSLQGYFKGDSVKKIVAWVGLSYKVVQNEYCLDKGKLVFVLSTDKRYKYNDSASTLDYSAFEKPTTERYYFNNNKLMDAVLSDEGREKTKEQDAMDFLSSVKGYAKLLNASRRINK